MISLNISEEILKKHITYLLENGLEKRIGNLITVDLIEQIRHKLGGNAADEHEKFVKFLIKEVNELREKDICDLNDNIFVGDINTLNAIIQFISQEFPIVDASIRSSNQIYKKKSYKEIQKIKKKILNDYKDKIEWIEIEEVGTKCIVRVEERILTKNKKEISTQNIVAKKSAILTKIEAKNGEIVKNINDYVKKGDVVITGDIKLNEETKSITGADGKIYGEVWYKTTIEYPLHYKEVMMKKNKKTVYAIKFLNKDYSIEIHPFKTKKIKEKTLFKNNLLPLRIVKQYQTETKEINEKYTKSQAIKKATEMAKKKIESKLNDNEYIIDYKRLNVDENNSKIVLELFFSVCEDITDTQKIDMEQIEEQKEE